MNLQSLFSYFSVAPQIRPVPQNGRLVVYQGEAATLGCDILKGNPTPEITWRRKVKFRILTTIQPHNLAFV